MKIFDLFKKIEKDFPLNSAYDFDNPGVNVFIKNEDIKGILVTLDITDASIEYAKKNNVNLIISHHPLIFNPLKNIGDDTISNLVKKLIKYDITAYSMHTNFDVNLKLGMGKLVTNILFDKKEIKSHECIETFVKNKIKYGLADFVVLKKSKSIENILLFIRNKLKIDEKKITAYTPYNLKMISKIVILPGSGSGNVEDVIRKKPDLYITSDLKHNQILELLENDIYYIDATHYGLEKPFVNFLLTYIKKLYNIKIYTYFDERV